MTKVFVHGNPEVADIWFPLVDSLGKRGIDDVVLLSPPGFGAVSPPDWDPLPANYVAWLAAELQALDGPIDLVGHDWGAGHVFGLLAEHPNLVRSWAADCVGLLHPEYVWHDMAQIWQTEGAGEEAVAAMLKISDADRTEAYGSLGLPNQIAAAMAAGCTHDMARCILGLYRAAKQPVLAELGARLVASTPQPGLVLDATADPYVSSELARAMLEPLGAEHLVLEGNGHWWMCENPDVAADGLVSFWSQQS